ncbi:alpha/beta hydrolase [Maricaulis sp.]|uniref:alpha/beta hydrolase n=1 Tax=Maricaulis sp. TaxID=1486257 RepID=UPI002B27A838|nr:alpha/beta hydrolase-fold protein [Maricaulis sp.]
MLRLPTLLACLALVTAAGNPVLAQSNTTSQPAADGAVIPLGIRHEIRSETLGQTRTINIWLPPGHDTAETPYTVLYLIDGGVDQDFPHIAGLAQLGVISWQFQPLIVVGIETEVRLHELTPSPQDHRYVESFDTAGGASDFRRYIADDIIPFIESHYRVGDRRAIIGESLAGLFVVDTLLEQPELFDDYIAVSPSLWWDDQAAAKAAAERLAAADRDDWRLYLTMADEGGTMQAGLDRLLLALEGTPGAPEWRHVDRSTDETHSTIYHPAALDALRWLYSYPPYDYGPAPWYLRDGASPEDDAP